MAEHSKKIYYFDHAASSWPKPPVVTAAMTESVMEYGANPGRGSHQLSMRASRAIFEARKNIAHLFQIQNPNDIFFFQNATAALNQAIKGFLKPGDHVITTSLEHNSVRRPLEYLREQKHIQVTYISANREGKIDLKEIEKAISERTKLIVCTHSSNLLGTILPIEEIAGIAQRKGIKILLDAAQTAGTYPIQVSSMEIDMLAFPGHKGLLGPQGIGGLYVNPAIELEPLIHGGTGSQSELIQQPTVRPDRYESGTMNTPGIAGLNAGVQYVTEQTVEVIHKKELMQIQYIMQELLSLNKVKLFGPSLNEDKTGITAFQIKGIESSSLAFMLDRHYGIAVRAGYHCTPLAHQTIGTSDEGAVRISVGNSTTGDEIDYLIDSIKEIAQKI